MTTQFEVLTAFQRDLLYVTAGLDRPAGSVIKRELESRIGPITHGRLYPALDTLVESGFIEKGEQDGRTNSYTVTDAGRIAIADRENWEATTLAGADITVGSTSVSTGSESSV